MDQKQIIKAKEAVAKTLEAKFANKGDFTRQISKAKRHPIRATSERSQTRQKEGCVVQAGRTAHHPEESFFSIQQGWCAV